MYDNPITSRPVALSASTESQVYSLFALAMAITAGGVWVGMQFASVLLNSPLLIALTFVELGLIFTATLWMEKSPLNILLFGLFPLLSGMTVTPYLMWLLVAYTNGGSILLNALAATAFMSLAVGIFAKTTSWNLGVMGKFLFMALLGLLAFGIAQIFIPSLQTTQAEMIYSGLGILIFAGFLAYDIQRIGSLGRMGANPFLLALRLYLDIFNLFLFILRLMTALSGDRR